ncbi:MAG: glycoside hydrolase family 3 N-terminal domain-containing protein [Phycisphaerae bacterium]
MLPHFIRRSVVLALILPAFAEPPRAAEVNIEKLIFDMTLAEKLGQLTQQGGGLWQDANPGERAQKLEEIKDKIRVHHMGTFLGANGAAHTNALQRVALEETRLKIPLMFANDVIHGYRTIFPIPLASACSWRPDLIERECRIAATEARAAGTHWTYAPMIDVCRDPRWGRIAETAGEDPYLGSVIAAARVQGFQGDNLAANDAVLACGKHYVAYGGAEGGRDYNTVDISPQTLHEIHLPTFEAAVVDAGVASIMTAFNEINGVPASGNLYTLRDVLRNDWGFHGIVVTDFNSIAEMITHGYAADAADAAQLAITAGVDIEMMSTTYRDTLPDLIERGIVPMSLIDQSVRRVLQAKKDLGLFENPYTDEASESVAQFTAENREAARELARHSIVLLKNEANLLPLKKDLKEVAIIGPLMGEQRDALGTWAGVGRAEEAVAVATGIRRALTAPNFVIKGGKGCEVDQPIAGGIARAVEDAKSADLTILVLGETEKMSGEALCRADIGLPQAQLDLAKALHETGKPIVVVLMSGRPLAIPWLAENMSTILCTWHLGSEHGNAVADVLFGDFNPGGKLTATWPRVTGQIPLHYNHKMTGRPPKKDSRFNSKYIDVDWTPQYPFGYGLSYTTFEYANLDVAPTEVGPFGTVRISVQLTNTDNRDGDEVVQVYYRDPVARMTRPVRQLCAFERVSLKAGESREVAFDVPVQRFAYFDADMQQRLDDGEIQFFVGTNSTATMTKSITITSKPQAPARGSNAENGQIP